MKDVPRLAAPTADREPGLTVELRFAPRALAPWPGWQKAAYDEHPAEQGLLARTRAFQTLTRPYEIPWVDGTRFTLWPGEALSAAIARTGGFEISTALALKGLLFPAACCIDAGANAGAHTVPTARWCRQVIAVEPSPRELDKLRHNIAINLLPNVTVVPAALGATSGRAILRVAPDAHAGLNTLAPRFGYAIEAARELEVDVITLDSLNAQVDVIKMDVEGAETDLIRGGWRTIKSYRPALILEAETAILAAYGSSTEDLEDLLRQLRYRLHVIDDRTGSLVPITALAERTGENIVALPPERA